MELVPLTADRRNRVISVGTLLEGWSRVDRIVYEQTRTDGRVQLQDRDLLNRGDCVTVLLFNRAMETVILLRQPRIAATLRVQTSDVTIEACSGLLGTEAQSDCAFREVEEEAGWSVDTLIRLGSFYASPGASLELVHIFLAEYDGAGKLHRGGGLEEEGEDIEVIEVPLARALDGIEEGAMQDARTVIPLLMLDRLVRNASAGQRLEDMARERGLEVLRRIAPSEGK